MPTAGHCAFDANQEQTGIKFDMEVTLGTVDLNSKAQTEVRRKVVKVIVHEDFSYNEKANDIALLKLNQSLDFEGTEKLLQPVCLPKASDEFFDNCFATGFGFQDAQMLTNDYKLHSLAEVHQPGAKCDKQFINFNETTQICIGGKLNHGTCKVKLMLSAGY